MKLTKNIKKIASLGLISALALTQSLSVQGQDVSWGIPKVSEGEVQPYPGAYYDEIITNNDAYYIGNPEEKHVYLTFDCGYENGNLPMILDALKAHETPALFFLTGHFMESEPELVKRMVNEGHLVGNHTYYHPNLTTVSKETFMEEMVLAEEKFYDITGQQMDKYLRPPEGRFNQNVLDWAKEAGYYTILWSLAYVDWHVDEQKGADHAVTQVMNRLHPGAIILLHSTSSDNAAGMSEMIEQIKATGYEFKCLNCLLLEDLDTDFPL